MKTAVAFLVFAALASASELTRGKVSEAPARVGCRIEVVEAGRSQTATVYAMERCDDQKTEGGFLVIRSLVDATFSSKWILKIIPQSRIESATVTPAEP